MRSRLLQATESKAFFEVEFQDGCGGATLLATVHEVSGVDKIISNTSPMDKPSLIRIYD
jgi:hypothetical protein